VNHTLTMYNNNDKFIRSSRPLVSKHEIRSLCIGLLAFQCEPIFIFHQGTCHNRKALKRGTHESFGEHQHNFNKLALIFIEKIKNACKKHKIKIDASNEYYELFI